MLRAEEELKVNILSSRDFALSWLNSVMSLFILECNFLLILLFVDTPMEWDHNRG